MKTLNITLPETLEVGGPAGHERSMSTANWTEEFLLNMMLHGIKQRRTDRFSVVKSNDGISKATEALAALDASLLAGELPSGGGGGGPRLSIEDAGMIQFFNSKGSPVRISKQVANGKNLSDYIAIFVQKAIWPSVAKAISGMPKDEQIAFHKTKLPQLVRDNTAKVLAVAQKDPNGMGSFIEAERKKREGTKETGFSVDIEISL
jgi:hypothetical protein